MERLRKLIKLITNTSAYHIKMAIFIFQAIKLGNVNFGQKITNKLDVINFQDSFGDLMFPKII